MSTGCFVSQTSKVDTVYSLAYSLFVFQAEMLKRQNREIEVIVALEKFEMQNDGKLFSKLCQITCLFQLLGYRSEGRSCAGAS